MNPPPLFPPHIRSFEAAVAFVVNWVDMVGGGIASDLAVLNTADPVTLEQVATKIVATHINLAR